MICKICNEEFEPTCRLNTKYCSKECAKKGNLLLVRKRYYERNKDKHIHWARKSHYKHRYNITLDDYNSLFNIQNGKCAICNQPESIRLRKDLSRLSVDHNHKNGKVRGLLCHRCNRALGYFNDNPLLLIKAIKYLKRSNQ